MLFAVVAVRQVRYKNRSLALLNWLNLLLIPSLLVAAALWLTSSAPDLVGWRNRVRDERAMVEGYFDRLTDLLLNKNLRHRHPATDGLGQPARIR